MGDKQMPHKRKMVIHRGSKEDLQSFASAAILRTKTPRNLFLKYNTWEVREIMYFWPGFAPFEISTKRKA